ncbi:MAG: ImmA/IrrE family metallo-endopeptidase [Moorea sp. SIO3I7]|uniref:ImmA/IrrE family metallo-endopeptidase n=1 Tax=Moorena sp. SIO3I8 TaxID=2607833 RepID=UPI0013C19110|nr:hypothetical protein [Moorena sp. SIO3I8]NEN94557.1 ImmA/IrrE family metallo-endopeptidase [Moorena sp. SIO3I7]NEO06283.1 ImmA/IrrE family metallo-endopeptidase [Moorena sp. SIO3I8]
MNNRQRFVFRFLVLLVSGALVAWLVFDNNHWSGRKSAIEKALSQGTIGQLSSREEKHLQELLDELASVSTTDSKCNIQVILNKPFSEDGLNVFTTTPDLKKLTKCKYADAIYDAGLDAVFLDKSLLRSSRISCTFGSCKIDYFNLSDPTAEIYLRYIILHEFGHKCLHRNLNFLSIFFASSDAAKKIEREADYFAQEAIQRLGEKGKLPSPAGRARWIHLPPSTPISPSDKVQVALADMANEITDALLFSDAPYSSISDNKTHDSFVTRSLEVLERTNSIITSDDVSGYVNFAIQQIERIRDVTPLLKAEIHLEEKDKKKEITQRVSFEKDQLIIFGNEGGIFSIPYSDIRNACRYKPCAAKTAKKINSLSSDLLTDLLNPFTQVVATKAFGTLISIPGKGFFSIHQNKWIEVSDSISFPFNWEYIITPSQPSDVFLIVSKKDSDRIFNYVQLGEPTVSKSQTDLCREISLEGGAYKCSMEPEFAGDEIYFLVKDLSNKNRLGVVFENAKNLEFTTYKSLKAPPGFSAFSTNMRFVITHDYNKWSYYAVTHNFDPYLLHKEKYQITLWKLSEVDDQAKIIDQHQLTLEAIPRGNQPRDWLNVRHPSLLTCQNISSSSVICTAWNDSIYGFNSVTEKLYPVFHPSGVNNQSGGGLVAYWTNNGHKVIVMDGSRNDL